MALRFVLLADRRLESGLLLGTPGLAGGLDTVALDRGQHAGGLLAAHHRDARVRPHPQETRAVSAAAHAIVAGAERTADHHREFRHFGASHCGHHLGAVARDAAVLVLAADHETSDVLQENQRDSALCAELDEMCGLQRGLRKEDAVVGDDADRIAPDVREAADDRRPVARLELVKIRTIDDARNDFAHVERLLAVGRNHAVQLVGRIERRARFDEADRRLLLPVEIADDAPGDGQRVRVVFSQVIDDAGDARMHIGAAKVFGADHFTGRRLDQRGAAEKDGSLILDDDRFIRHRRHIGATGGARAHYGGDLRNALRREIGLVEKDAAEVLLVGKHLILHRQEGAARIDQVDAGQMVFGSDFLRPQMLLDGQRIVGTALHRRIVGNDHAFDAVDAADAGDQGSRSHVTAIHAIGG